MTKLERSNPELTALAAQVMPGQRIRHRSGAYWLGDVQITYDRATGDDGRETELDWSGKVALAERILRGILAARADPAWGDRWTRH